MELPRYLSRWFAVALLAPLLAGAGDDPLEAAKAAIRMKEFASAVAVLRSAASQHDARAQYLLASLQHVGLGLDSDPLAARALLLEAAKQDHAAAAYALASSYANESPLDLEAAQQWLRRAASLGHGLGTSAIARGSLPLQFLPQKDLNDATARRAALWIAVRQDDIATVEALGDRELLKATDDFGRGALARAAEHSAVNALKLLLAHGANPNQADAYGTTPLMLAAAHADLPVVELLLRANADADAVDRNGNTALMYAAARETAVPSIVERLFAAAAQPASLNAQGWSALDWAMGVNDSVVVSMLRERGIPVRSIAAVVSDTPRVPLRHATNADLYRTWSDPQVAASRSTSRLLDALRRERDDASMPAAALHAATVAESQTLPYVIDTARKDDSQAVATLRWAIQHATPATVKALIAGSRLKSGATEPLLVAIGAQRIEIVRLLLDAGADANAVDPNGRSALMLAAASAQSDVVNELLGQLARVDARDEQGRNALWYAAAVGEQAAVSALIAARSRVDEADQNGQTPLAIAAANGHAGVVASLLAAGADRSVASAMGATPLMLAAQSGSVATLRSLLDVKTAIDAQNRHGDTALIMAARLARADAVRALLAAGASAKLRNADRMSALDVAQALGLREIEKVLLGS